MSVGAAWQLFHEHLEECRSCCCVPGVTCPLGKQLLHDAKTQGELILERLRTVDLKPTWVRVGSWAAIISYPARRRYGKAYEPTWLVLGPKREGEKLRPTVASGSASTVDGVTSLVTASGILPPDLEPALLEAARALVQAYSAQARPR